jgi:predicted permease
MTQTPTWRRYLRFWRANVAEDVEDELRFHTEMRVAEYIARGMTEDEARRAVAARLGDVGAARAECIALGEVRERHARRAGFFDALRTDVHFALRSLARSPGWTVVALLTIALGVGTTTTVFSVADSLLIRPLGYRDESRVYVARREITLRGEQIPDALPIAVVQAWRDHARTIQAAVPFSTIGDRFGTEADAPEVMVGLIDAAFVPFTGVRPVRGRNFTPGEIVPGGQTPMLLSEQFWKAHYGGSEDALGRVVVVGGRPRVIVGVLPSSVGMPNVNIGRVDVWVPFDPVATARVPGVAVRLQPGVSADAARQELDRIASELRLPVQRFGPEVPVLTVTRPQDRLRFRQTLVMLTGAVALLLLVACANIAHLLLARGASRQRELAVRHALGAERSRLLRQLVTESVVLAALGSVMAAFVGWAGVRLLAAIRPDSLSALTRVTTDRRLLWIAAAVAIGTGLLIGLLSALRSAHRHLGPTLRAGASTVPRTGRLRASLVVGEVALSATLLVGALLLIHTVYSLERTKLGFDVRGVYGVSFRLGKNEAAQAGAYVATLREQLGRIPGVEGVTEGSIGFFTALSSYETRDGTLVGDGPGDTDMREVSADFFAVLRMPLVSGRTFDSTSRVRNEVVVSQSLARHLWPDGKAVGREFRSTVQRPGGPPEPWQTVIGVAPDIVARDVTEGTGRQAIYRPVGAERGAVNLLVRLDRPDAMTTLRQFAAASRPGQPAPDIQNLKARIDRSLAQPRFIMQILVTFATVGVLLAAIGLYGVIAYTVGQRTREIGVRLALGATGSEIARLVLGNGIRLALAGIVLGFAGSVAATRLIQSTLYGVPRLDPFAFGAGAVVMLLLAVVACLAPTRRAASLDPVVALRVDG